MSTVSPISVMPVAGLPEISPRDPLGRMIAERIEEEIGGLQAGDIVVVTHKIISKAEGQLVDLSTVSPSPLAVQLAERHGKDARQVEMVLRESARIVRMSGGHIISETHHGLICANAGVDASNTDVGVVSLLPRDPDASAARLREHLVRDVPAEDSERIGVIVTDSFGRPWRNGIVNVAIGVAGISPLADYRGQFDAAGHELRSTVLAVADELAAAAELVMHKTQAIPVAVVRGYSWQIEGQPGTGQDLIMPVERDLFR
ncbi:MAG TPA: coenzyme F420-0:L-glutamate ligase [Thermomicrobiales bacterium]|nr:coenzyme F420-0:L-glutamate ligase [Thermomicrobiales bacterium]